MKNLALACLLSLACVAPAQTAAGYFEPTPPAVWWSLSGPASAPTVTLSPDGKWLSYVSSDGVRLLEAATRRQLRYWPIKANGDRQPVAAFSPDSSSIVVLLDPGKGWVEGYSTRLPEKLVFSSKIFGQGTNAVDLVCLRGGVIGVVPNEDTVSGVPYASVELYVSDWGVNSICKYLTKFSHANALLPWRLCSSTNEIFFFNSSYNLATKSSTTLDYTLNGVTYEPWTVGVDPKGGLIQQIAKKTSDGYELQGFRRFLTTVRWSKPMSAMGGDFYEGPMQFATLPNGTGIGMMGSGDKKRLSAMNWSTGEFLFTTDLDSNGKGIEWGKAIACPGKADIYARYGQLDPSAQPRTGQFTLGATGESKLTSDLSRFVGGFRQVQAGGSYVVALTKAGELHVFSERGVFQWSMPVPGIRHFSAPNANGRMIIATDGGARVVNCATGVTVASRASKFKWVYWYGPSALVGIGDDGKAGFFGYADGSITPKFVESGFAEAAEVAPELGYIAGISGTTLKVVWPATQKKVVKSIPAGTRIGSKNLIADSDGLGWIVDVDSASKWCHVPPPSSTGIGDVYIGGKYGWPTYLSQTVRQFSKRRLDAANRWGAMSVIGSKGEWPAGSSVESLNVNLPESSDILDGGISDDYWSAAVLFGGNNEGDRSDLIVARLITYTLLDGASGSLKSGERLKITLPFPARKGGERFSLKANRLYPDPPKLTISEGETVGTFDTVGYTDTNVNVSMKLGAEDPELPECTPVFVHQFVMWPASFWIGTPSGVIGGKESARLWVERLGRFPAGNVIKINTSAPGLVPSPPDTPVGEELTSTITLSTSRVTVATKVDVTCQYGAAKAQVVPLWLYPPYMKELITVKEPTKNGGDASIQVSLNQTPIRRSLDIEPSVPVKLKLEWGAESKEITLDAKTIADTVLIPTPLVSEPTTLKITGTTELSDPATVTLNLKPAVLSLYRLNSTTVVAGQKLTGTLKLNAPAGPNDVITLTSSSSRLTLPATVKVTPGSDVATFELATTAGAKTAVVITATLRGVTLKKTVTVTATQ